MRQNGSRTDQRVVDAQEWVNVCLKGSLHSVVSEQAQPISQESKARSALLATGKDAGARRLEKGKQCLKSAGHHNPREDEQWPEVTDRLMPEAAHVTPAVDLLATWGRCKTHTRFAS
jgi:hypothetical protein